ncbi:hypothetical protein BpHYR1_030655 [Brachionus plicatilis]|uniref:Uncharacterized protein n=1 Tax=Brachionus plicatilis TaxID=10195 RepID=A0A3M7P6A4_BRAPC|nr:hypothetical protein BpHYR1_030655 [Brachionus plicatilis]
MLFLRLDSIKNFKIFNVKFSPPSDLFPSELKLEFKKYEKFLRHYKSVSIKVKRLYSTKTTNFTHQAECTLVLNSNTYQNLTNNLSFNRENAFADFTQVFHLNLHIKEKKNNLTKESWIKVALERTDLDDEAYRVVRVWTDENKRNNQQRTKRSSKTKLVVESCVLIDFAMI